MNAMDYWGTMSAEMVYFPFRILVIDLLLQIHLLIEYSFYRSIIISKDNMVKLQAIIAGAFLFTSYNAERLLTTQGTASSSHPAPVPNNVVLGSANAVGGNQNFLHGNGNYVVGHQNGAIGHGNVAVGNGNLAVGNANGIGGHSNTVLGSYNGVLGNANFVHGHANNVQGTLFSI